MIELILKKNRFSFYFFPSKIETKLAPHINIFNDINSDTILAKFQLRFDHILTVLAPFLITFLTQLKLKESFDDKINTIFINLECVLPEKEKGIDKYLDKKN